MYRCEGPPTCRDLLRQAESRLALHGVATPRLDAEVLLAHALRIDRTALYARLGETPPDDAKAAFFAAVERRRQREPVAYIVGKREFWSLTFVVNPDVLIPRPETELLVALVCEAVRGGRVPNGVSPLICDVGTGSGCIAVSLARELPQARLVATDLSPAALTVARYNACAYGVEAQVRFVHSDLFAGLPEGERFDVIVANPPYVPDGDATDPETEWEPRLALRGGRTGMEISTRLLLEAPRRLRPGGRIVMELGQGQAETAAILAENAGMEGVQIRPDLSGIPRALIATWGNLEGWACRDRRKRTREVDRRPGP